MLTAYFAMARSQVEAPRRRRREVHRRRRRRRVRGPGGARGRPRARGAGRPPDHGGGRPRSAASAMRPCGSGSASTPARPSSASTSPPGSGEQFLAGDAINTASRIQSAAPEMGVAVGLRTFEATRAIFDYEELPPASLKGKAEPVRVFHANAPRARLGIDLTRGHATPVRRAGDRPRAARRTSATRPRRELDRSWSRSSASPGSARAGSSRSSGPCRTPGPSPRRGGRAAACLRRGDLVLGARRARQGPGRHPATRTTPSSRSRSSTRSCRTARSAPGSASGCSRCSGSGPRGRRSRGAVHGLAPVPRARSPRTPDRPRRRGPPLGRPGDARLPRRARGPRGGGPAARAGDDPAGAAAHESKAAPARAPAAARRRRGGPPRTLLRRHRRSPRTCSTPSWNAAPATRSSPKSSSASCTIATCSPRPTAPWPRPDAELPVPESIQSLLAAAHRRSPAGLEGDPGDARVIGKVFWTGARRRDG